MLYFHHRWQKPCLVKKCWTLLHASWKETHGADQHLRCRIESVQAINLDLSSFRTYAKGNAKVIGLWPLSTYIKFWHPMRYIFCTSSELYFSIRARATKGFRQQHTALNLCLNLIEHCGMRLNTTYLSPAYADNCSWIWYILLESLGLYSYGICQPP